MVVHFLLWPTSHFQVLWYWSRSDSYNYISTEWSSSMSSSPCRAKMRNPSSSFGWFFKNHFSIVESVIRRAYISLLYNLLSARSNHPFSRSMAMEFAGSRKSKLLNNGWCLNNFHFRNRGYPQSLILKLDQTSDIFRIDVTAHPQLIRDYFFILILFNITISFNFSLGENSNTNRLSLVTHFLEDRMKLILVLQKWPAR